MYLNDNLHCSTLISLNFNYCVYDINFYESANRVEKRTFGKYDKKFAIITFRTMLTPHKLQMLANFSSVVRMFNFC